MPRPLVALLLLHGLPFRLLVLLPAVSPVDIPLLFGPGAGCRSQARLEWPHLASPLLPALEEAEMAPLAAGMEMSPQAVGVAVM